MSSRTKHHASGFGGCSKAERDRRQRAERGRALALPPVLPDSPAPSVVVADPAPGRRRGLFSRLFGFGS